MAAKKAGKKAGKKAAGRKVASKKATAKKSATKKAATRKAAKGSARKAAQPAATPVVVASRVKDAVRSQDVRVSGDFVDALDGHVNEVLGRAVERARANNRSTLRPEDL